MVWTNIPYNNSLQLSQRSLFKALPRDLLNKLLHTIPIPENLTTAIPLWLSWKIPHLVWGRDFPLKPPCLKSKTSHVGWHRPHKHPASASPWSGFFSAFTVSHTAMPRCFFHQIGNTKKPSVFDRSVGKNTSSIWQIPGYCPLRSTILWRYPEYLTYPIKSMFLLGKSKMCWWILSHSRQIP